MPESKFGIRWISSTYHDDQQPCCCSSGGSRYFLDMFWGCLGREEQVYLFILPKKAPVGLSVIVIAIFIMAEVCAAKGFVHSEMACIWAVISFSLQKTPKTRQMWLDRLCLHIQSQTYCSLSCNWVQHYGQHVRLLTPTLLRKRKIKFHLTASIRNTS